MSDYRDITKDIVVAMIQNGILLPEKQKGVEIYNKSSIENVKIAYKEIFQAVKESEVNGN